MVKYASALMWWSIWGFVVGLGLFGFQEAHRNSVYLVVAVPLLAGAGAAAAVRLRHEYREAMRNAKWLALAVFLVALGSGTMYLRTESYGPFASGTTYKAFLGTTFEMTVPEVERILGRRLNQVGEKPASEESGNSMLALVPDFERRTESRELDDIALYQVPCQVRFDFVAGRLARVKVEFKPTLMNDTPALLQHLLEDLSKDYKPEPTAQSEPVLYRKEGVDATIYKVSIDDRHQQVSAVLQYLPLADKQTGPLTVDSHAF